MVRWHRIVYRAASLISCGLYLLACALPATDRWHVSQGGSPDRYQIINGSSCLLFGWLSLLLGEVAWLANPFALIAAILLTFRRPTGAAAFSAVSLVLAMLYILVPPGGSDHPDVPRVGAWIWLGSFLALFTAAMVRRGGPAELICAAPRDALLARHPGRADSIPAENQPASENSDVPQK